MPIGRSQPAPPIQDFACQLIGRTKGVRARWGLGLMTRQDELLPRHLNISLGIGGFLHHDSYEGKLTDTWKEHAESVSHAAIKRGEQVRNTLLVVVRGRQVEIYVNGVAVRDPILMDKPIPSPRLLLLGVGGSPQGGTAEFESITVWPTDSIPSLAQRGARPKP